MDQTTAAADLDFITNVIQRTQRRIDPHAFHYVLWGSLVLVCYPLLNWFQNSGNLAAMGWIGGGALLIGTLGSALTEFRLARDSSRQSVRPRLWILPSPGTPPVARSNIGSAVASHPPNA